MEEKLPAYYQVKHGRGYWHPSKKLQLLGFKAVRCGPDGPEARNTAEEWNARAKATAGGELAPPSRAKRIRGYVYFLVAGDRIKIGFSQDPFTRIGGLRTGMNAVTHAMLAIEGTRQDERRLHARFQAYRIGKSEWFVATATLRRTMMRVIAFDGIPPELLSEIPDEIAA